MKRSRAMLWKVALAAAALVCVVAAAAAQALRPGPPDPANGRRLAETLCTSCHVVSSGQPQPGGAAIAGIPSFAAIANHANQTPERLAGAIILPHPPMPSVALTNTELRDVIAYILSLKAQ